MFILLHHYYTISCEAICGQCHVCIYITCSVNECCLEMRQSASTAVMEAIATTRLHIVATIKQQLHALLTVSFLAVTLKPARLGHMMSIQSTWCQKPLEVSSGHFEMNQSHLMSTSSPTKVTGPYEYLCWHISLPGSHSCHLKKYWSLGVHRIRPEMVAAVGQPSLTAVLGHR